MGGGIGIEAERAVFAQFDRVYRDRPVEAHILKIKKGIFGIGDVSGNVKLLAGARRDGEGSDNERCGYQEFC